MTLEMQSSKTAGANGHSGHETVYVDQFIDGILDPNKPMLGPVRDGGSHHRQYGARLLGTDAYAGNSRRP